MIACKEVHSQSISAPDIVKQGYLFVKRPPGNHWNKLKAWHKRFFILRDTGSEQGAELAMFYSQADSRINSPSLGVVLRDTVHIGIASESHRFPNVLVVVFNGRSPLLLAAEDELTAKSWMLALDLTCQNANLKGSSTLTWQSFGNKTCSTSSSSVSSSNCLSTSNNTHSTFIANQQVHQVSPTPMGSSSVPTTNSGSAESDESGCSCAPAFVRESSKYGSHSDASSNNSQNSSSLTNGTLEDLATTNCISSLGYNESDDFCLNNFITIGSPKERYSIFFETTEASERVGLRGNLELVVFARGIGIARKGDSECFLLWPISVIRQYRLESMDKHSRRKYNKSKVTLVTIEVGRRCLTGEGIFKFTSDQGHDIMRKLEKAVNNWALHRARLTCTRSMYNSQHRKGFLRSCNHEFCKFNSESSINGSCSHRSAPSTPALNKLNLTATNSTSCSGRSSCIGGSLTWSNNAGADCSKKSLLKSAKEHLRNSLNSIGTRNTKLPKIDVNDDFGYISQWVR
uniref:Uncharacterized protein n=1 Tax=Tetranychus urticae TaxID=32264 RepID=T1KMN9_TETUR